MVRDASVVRGLRVSILAKRASASPLDRLHKPLRFAAEFINVTRRLLSIRITGSLVVLNRIDCPIDAISIVLFVSSMKVKARIPTVNINAVGSSPKTVKPNST